MSTPWPSLVAIALVLSLVTDASPRLVLLISDDGTYQYGPLDPRRGDRVRGTWTVEHCELVLVAGAQIERAPVTVHEACSRAKSGLTFGDKTFMPSD